MKVTSFCEWIKDTLTDRERETHMHRQNIAAFNLKENSGFLKPRPYFLFEILTENSLAKIGVH